jgi:PhnB protein
MQLNPYLNFNGNTEEAFNFYQSVFGGELSIMKFKGTPGCEEMSEEDQNKVVHASLPIGSQMLMATDFLESSGQKLVVGNNVNISLHPESKEEADRLFKGLSEGGMVEMPMADAFWGDYFGAFKDKFGISWLINCAGPKK